MDDQLLICIALDFRLGVQPLRPRLLENLATTTSCDFIECPASTEVYLLVQVVLEGRVDVVAVVMGVVVIITAVRVGMVVVAVVVRHAKLAFGSSMGGNGGSRVIDASKDM